MVAKRSTRGDVTKQIRSAREAARRMVSAPWYPVAASYDPSADHVLIGLRSGVVIAIPRPGIKELLRASQRELVDVVVVGDGLRWEQLDLDVSVAGLLREMLGEGLFLREAGGIRGRVRSRAKADAARANGAKGGRPRKTA